MAITDTTTLLVAMRDIARDIAGDVPAGTATDGTSSQIEDTSVDSPIRSSLHGADYWKGKWAYVSAGTNSGVERRIATSAATGQINLDQVYASAIDTTSVYEIWPFSRTVLRQAVRDALLRCMHEDWLLVTELADGDFRASGVSDRTNSNASSSKITTEANLLMGPQALRVLNSGANGYSRLTTAHPVRQLVGYRVEAQGRETVGTADLVIWDDTNNAEIDSLSTAQSAPDPGTGFFRLVINFVTPDGCNAIQVRHAGVGASDDIAWSFVSLHRQATREYVLSTTIEDPQWVAAAYWRLHGVRSGAVERLIWHQVERTRGPGTALTLRVSEGPRDGTLWCRLHRPYVVPSADTDTTACPPAWFESAATVELLTPIADQNPVYTEKLARAQARFRRNSRLYQAHVPRFDQLVEPF